MRYFLILAAALFASGAIAAEKTVEKRVFGKYEVTFLQDVTRQFEFEQCMRLKPFTGQKRNAQGQKAGGIFSGKIIGDGCLGCSVSPVFDCSRKELRTETRRVSGFEIALRNGKDFKLSDSRAARLLRRYCRASGKRFSPIRPSGGKDQKRQAIQWFGGTCK